LGPILGLGPERNLGPDRIIRILGRASREKGRSRSKLRFSRRLCDRVFSGLDGVVWSELRFRRWPSLLRLRRRRNPSGRSVHRGSHRIRHICDHGTSQFIETKICIETKFRYPGIPVHRYSWVPELPSSFRITSLIHTTLAIWPVGFYSIDIH
jgi:hypothetical protein